jgi:hypothetical protein
MSRRKPWSALSLALGAVLIVCPAVAAETALHTGAIVATNTKSGTITIEEMGPWHGPTTRPVPREFHLTPRTMVELAVRKQEPGGHAGMFIDRPLTATDLRPGDYATVTAEREGGKAVATRIEIVRPGERTTAGAVPPRAEVPVLGRTASARR